MLIKNKQSSRFSKIGNLLILLMINILSSSCEKLAKENDGEALAKIYCVSCHSFTEPSLADKKTWLNEILPGMGPRLGMVHYKGTNFPSIATKAIVKDLYPNSPVMAQKDWEKIVEYFVKNAPENLNNRKPSVPIVVTDRFFTTVYPDFDKNTQPTTSCVKFDQASRRVFCAESVLPKVNIYDSNFKLQKSIKINNIATDIIPVGEGMVVLIMGTLEPFDLKSGQLQWFSDMNQARPLLLASNLNRPVNVNSADLDQDGKTDYVVCGFGHLSGSLFWLQNKGGNKYVQNELRSFPGAMKTVIGDFNKDGLNDIAALMAQGDEGVFIYLNQGNQKFTEKALIRFPPIYGSTSFEFHDFNNDGQLDLIYTSGDNADYSQILKPYHGVYIFINDGQWNFNQRFFYPINGCSKAIARDFDLDGDLDIATISFFADYQSRPTESFVFLKNNGGLNFESSTVPSHVDGRWLTMDSGDYDSDGDEDIILGNMSIGPSSLNGKRDWKTKSPFIVLKNKTIDKNDK